MEGLTDQPGEASKAILGVFSFGESLELVFIHDTFMKEMHTDHTVSAFGWTIALHVFSRGNVNAHTYRDDILDADVCEHSYVQTISDVFVLQDDNRRSHRDHIVDAYLEHETIQCMQ
ncbi:hypothetical protein TNCV_1357171 [Trichonephila clavipes]|uniref:Uncharacterized protein n=1 Tax=Trichonephila clavipes TaxID=2585209 RepID=A0A8X6S9S9_TRICX|nr:hypothetical protein TNCV_1357171 [Trichonephila clavipes]